MKVVPLNDNPSEIARIRAQIEEEHRCMEYAKYSPTLGTAKHWFITTNPGSEIAALRQRIEAEHQAACYALTGLAEGTPKHWFINRRMQQIERHREALARLIGEQASIALINEVFEQSPPQKPG